MIALAFQKKKDEQPSENVDSPIKVDLKNEPMIQQSHTQQIADPAFDDKKAHQISIDDSNNYISEGHKIDFQKI